MALREYQTKTCPLTRADARCSAAIHLTDGITVLSDAPVAGPQEMTDVIKTLIQFILTIRKNKNKKQTLGNGQASLRDAEDQFAGHGTRMRSKDLSV